ncbi:MAG: hypothetical protein A6F72_05840 [Cycloclasticus sp. symbiont of Poecilosclerida sp. N]|nr:MAG: hypothetical protein A6F72_05840 [Cycloclasticus sp. symbiont of Poecilosclerida sp. N]
MKYFIAGAAARSAASLIGIQRNTTAMFFHKLRKNIALVQQSRREQFSGKIELYERYFGDIRKAKRAFNRPKKSY